MKKILILQLLFIYTIAVSQETQFKLYGAKFKASEILGSGSSGFGPFKQDHRTIFLDNRKVTNELFDILGQTYKTTNLASTSTFLNLYSSSEQPVLDEINMRFYFENGFEKIFQTKPSYLKDTSFLSFKKKYTDLYKNKKFSELREYLYDDANRNYRIELEISRYPKPFEKVFNLSTEQSKKITFGISVDIKAKIKEVAKIDGKLELKISDTINKKVVLNQSRFYEIEFVSEYLAIAGIVLKKYCENRTLLDGKDDVFSVYLKEYFKSTNTGIVTGAIILAISVDYEKYKEFKVSLGLVLKADAKLNDSQIQEINSKIDAMFISNTKREFSMTSGVTFYNLRYGYSDRLELGNGVSSSDKNCKPGPK